MTTSLLIRNGARAVRTPFTLTLLLTLLLCAVAASAQPQAESVDDFGQDQTAGARSAACALSFSPATQSFAAGGGTGSIAVTASPGCSWRAGSGAPWIKITSGDSGIGNGTVTFSVGATNSPRSGALFIAGKIFNVWQEFNSCGAPVFKATRRYPSGHSVTELVTADFNRDGKPDLAALSGHVQGDLNIAVHLNNGRGGFDAPIEIPMVSDPQDLTVADINRDGNVDLIATGLGYVRIFYGDGAGGFRMRRNIAITYYFHYSTNAADFNGDGNLDLAVSYADPYRNNEDYVTILLGNGIGGFTRTTTYIKGVVAAVADINKDQKPDLAVVNGVRGFTVYLGSGAGKFGLPIGNQVQRGYRNYQFKDMNRDGTPDLVYGAGVQLGDRSGHFGPLIPIPSSSQPLLFVTVDDFNNDSKPDIAGTSRSGDFYGNFAIALGDGTGKVKAPVRYSAVSWPHALVAADFNGDGQLDLAAAADNLSLLLNGCHAEPGIKISGRMTNQEGEGLYGSLTLSSPRIGTLVMGANFSGYYSFKDLDKNDVYTINAFIYPYDFTTRTVTNPITDRVVNFQGVLKDFSIKGTIMEYPNAAGIGGVTVELSGARTATTQTDENGNFSFDNLTAFKNYTLTVPPSTICSVGGSPSTIYNLNMDRTVGFWATRQKYGIRGRVKNGSTGVGGVSVVLTSPTPGGFAPRTVSTTATGGYYFANLPAGRTYIVKATKAQYTITPSSTTYTFLSAEQTTGDFAATPTPASLLEK
jgi:hypothetical protein